LLENTLELRRQITKLLRDHKPDIVMTIDPWRHYQLHPDHRVAGQAALDAIFSAREWNIFPEQLVGDMEPWRVKQAYLFWTDSPDYWEDISCCIDRRIAALARHASQVGLDVEKLTERVRRTAKEAGERPGYPYAEGFRRFVFAR
jgi:LmbE family N-acetylglucosaminyl deacetylase